MTDSAHSLPELRLGAAVVVVGMVGVWVGTRDRFKHNGTRRAAQYSPTPPGPPCGMLMTIGRMVVVVVAQWDDDGEEEAKTDDAMQM